MQVPRDYLEEHCSGATFLKRWDLSVPGTVHYEQRSSAKFHLGGCLCAANS